MTWREGAPIGGLGQNRQNKKAGGRVLQVSMKEPDCPVAVVLVVRAANGPIGRSAYSRVTRLGLGVPVAR